MRALPSIFGDSSGDTVGAPASLFLHTARPRTSFYLNCAAPDAPRTNVSITKFTTDREPDNRALFDPKCIAAENQWKSRVLEQDTLQPDEVCPLLRYIFLKTERKWFKCCAPAAYALAETPTLDLSAGTWMEVGQGALSKMKNSLNMVAAVQMNLIGKIFSAIGAGVKMAANPLAMIPVFVRGITGYYHAMKQDIFGKSALEMELLKDYMRVNKLTCKKVELVQGVGVNIGNLYLDGDGEVCFETAPAGFDAATGKYRLRAATECINLGANGEIANVFEIVDEKTGLARVDGNINAFGYGPRKRKYEAIFL